MKGLGMNLPKTLGELVRQDREKAGFTQGILTKRLRTAGFRVGINSTTVRTWVAKLETGQLKREFGSETRDFLARALHGDKSLYQALPIKINQKQSPVDGKLDVLPLIRKLAKTSRRSFTFDELLKICESYQSCERIGVSLFNPFAEK